MPFGMVNSGSTCNRMIIKFLKGTQNLENYVDDVLGNRRFCETSLRKSGKQICR